MTNRFRTLPELRTDPGSLHIRGQKESKNKNILPYKPPKEFFVFPAYAAASAGTHFTQQFSGRLPFNAVF
jgi:hypothetical protein